MRTFRCMRRILGSLQLFRRLLIRSSPSSLLMEATVQTRSSAAKPAENESCVEKPRQFLPLSHLNAQSARVGSWEVKVWEPKDISRDYLWQGQQRRTHGFQCTLVSTKDPKEYILATSHGKGVTAQMTKAFVDRFKHGLVFAMSKVVLAENSKRQYNSAPKAETVCVRLTRFDPVLLSTDTNFAMPEPFVPIAESMNINTEQHFEALGLIQEISETAPRGQLNDGKTRLRFTVSLLDGSANKDEEKPRLLPVTIFVDKPLGDTKPPLQNLRDAFDNRKALAFFHILGKKSVSAMEDTWSF